MNTPMLLGREELRVMDLVDTRRGCWNQTPIDRVFAIEEAVLSEFPCCVYMRTTHSFGTRVGMRFTQFGPPTT